MHFRRRILMQGAASRTILPLDLGIAFTGAWGMYPFSAAAADLFVLRRTSDSVEQTIARSGTGPDFAAISSFTGGGASRVKTLLDQVGSAAATEATAAQQPDYSLHLGFATADLTRSSSDYQLASGPTVTGRNFTVYAVYCVEDKTFTSSDFIPPSQPEWRVVGPFGQYQTNETRSAQHRVNMSWGTFPASGVPMLSGNCNVNIQVIRSNGSNTRLRINEKIVQSATLTSTSSGALDRIGLNPVGGFSSGVRLMGFLVGPAHTLAEEEAVVASLRRMFSDAPKTKLVMFDGDSQTSTHAESVSVDLRDFSWPYECMQAIADPSILGSNRAISSSQLVDGTADADKDLTVWAPNKLDSHLDGAIYSKQILVVMAGRNDIGVIAAAGSGLTTYNRLVTYCQARKTAGFGKIIVVNAIPAKDLIDGGWASEVADFNSRIAGNGLTDWDAVVDAAALNWQPGGAADWSTNYQGTLGVHPNAAGRTLLANAVKPVLQALLAA
jgi:lysophospholipase L1-like esterase